MFGNILDSILLELLGVLFGLSGHDEILLLDIVYCISSGISHFVLNYFYSNTSIIGGTYWGWMHIDVLWVHEDFRKKGIGSKLLVEAENEAIRRGCHHVHLDTMSWQAPEFYLNHGYKVIGILPDIPDGNKKYMLQKSL